MHSYQRSLHGAIYCVKHKHYLRHDNLKRRRCGMFGERRPLHFVPAGKDRKHPLLHGWRYRLSAAMREVNTTENRHGTYVEYIPENVGLVCVPSASRAWEEAC